jgi:hypothetical protein
MALRQQVLGGYKRLMRARLSAFQSDSVALSASRIELKQNYLLNKNVSSPAQIIELLKGVDEVEHMLTKGIAQAKLNEDSGNYGVKVTQDMVSHDGTTTDFNHAAQESEAEKQKRESSPGGIFVDKSSSN